MGNENRAGRNVGIIGVNEINKRKFDREDEEKEKAGAMNIKRAKQEIKNSIEAYLAKDEFGEYKIPAVRQRPVLLMGPPGVGKTQIMEQIARECKIGLVAYTITHHTRQSAVGLPFIKEKVYGGQTYSVTEYTMSEIIASVYEKIEQTGIKEGILFIDEINCVSETLAPTMLQFLQGKTFGNQKVPEGWIIVAAGNPPEYNKSVREFDVVTLDRLKKIDVEADFEVWKEYAYQQGIHPAVISYLELRKQNFYRVETTVDGKRFATARGWEDLSQLIQAYEAIGTKMDREVVFQYIQHPMIAKDFAGYLELYYKYRTDYGVEDILNGKWSPTTLQKIRSAALDEHLSIVSLLNGKLSELFRECHETDAFVSKLYEYMLTYREKRDHVTAEEILQKIVSDREALERAEMLNRAESCVWKRVTAFMENVVKHTKGNFLIDMDAYEYTKERFEEEAGALEKKTEEVKEILQNVFDFLEDAFGESQEMVFFITELNANSYSMWFIKENGSDSYYRYNKGLLFEERQKMILAEMDAAENALDRGIHFTEK